MCQMGGVQDSFLCPNGTIWNQEKFACQWWYEVSILWWWCRCPRTHNLLPFSPVQVSCAVAPSFYALNNNLYKEADGKLVPPGGSRRN